MASDDWHRGRLGGRLRGWLRGAARWACGLLVAAALLLWIAAPRQFFVLVDGGSCVLRTRDKALQILWVNSGLHRLMTAREVYWRLMATNPVIEWRRPPSSWWPRIDVGRFESCVSIPHWVIAAVAGLGAVPRRRRPAAHSCSRCGYSLVGLRAAGEVVTCPECGAGRLVEGRRVCDDVDFIGQPAVH